MTLPTIIGRAERIGRKSGSPRHEGLGIVHEEDLINLDDWIRRLKVEYTIFFNGHRKKPPEDLRIRVEKLLKKLAESNLTFQERFRYNTLVGRYYVLRDSWRRSIAARELGTEIKDLGTRRPPPPAKGQRLKPLQAISVSIADPEKEEEKIRQLYNALSLIRKSGAKAPPAVPYDQFAKYISAQAHGIRTKSGCPSVLFTLSVEENSIRFTAKAETPVRA